jgi:hypothetical protein
MENTDHKFTICAGAQDIITKFDQSRLERLQLAMCDSDPEYLQLKHSYLQEQTEVVNTREGSGVTALDILRVAAENTFGRNRKAFGQLCYFFSRAMFRYCSCNSYGTVIDDSGLILKADYGQDDQLHVGYYMDPNRMVSDLILNLEKVPEPIRFNHDCTGAGFLEITSRQGNALRLYPVGLDSGLDLFCCIPGTYKGPMAPYSDFEVSENVVIGYGAGIFSLAADSTYSHQIATLIDMLRQIDATTQAPDYSTQHFH